MLQRGLMTVDVKLQTKDLRDFQVVIVGDFFDSFAGVKALGYQIGRHAGSLE